MATKIKPTPAQKAKKDAAHAELIERGAVLQVAEDRFGDTKSGYWMDTCFLGKCPILALQVLLG
jgi:hypothetical protein